MEHPPPFQNFVSICIVKDQKWSCKKQKKNGYHGKKNEIFENDLEF